MTLEKSQIASFHRHGYLPVPDVIPESDLSRLEGDFTKLIDDVAGSWYDQGVIANLYESEPFEKRIASLSLEAGKSLQGSVSFPVNLRPAIFEFLHNKRLLDVIESIIGPEIYCNPTHHVRPKLPHEIDVDDWSGRSPFHQDAAVLLPEADDTLVITTWIPLVDANEDNGTIRVFPGLHEGDIRTHEKCPFGWTIKEDEAPIGKAVTIPMNKGGVVIIHGRTPHGSGPNRTDRVRWSMDLRWHDARKPAGRPLPGMLVRSRSHPLTTYDEWVQAWEIAKRDTTPRKMYRWQA